MRLVLSPSNVRLHEKCVWEMTFSYPGPIYMLSLLFLRSFSGNISCKLITDFLSVTTQYSYWSTSWVTISPFSAMRKKPHLAMVISFIRSLFIAGMHAHRLLFYVGVGVRVGEIVVEHLTSEEPKYSGDIK